MSVFNYASLENLSTLLDNIKAAYAGNDQDGTPEGKSYKTKFPVALAQTATLATKATGDGSGNNIINTYATKTEVSNTYVPQTRRIAVTDTEGSGVDLADNITKAELLTALNVEDGAQVNELEAVEVWYTPAGGEATKEDIVTMSGTTAKIDLSAYAKLADISRAVIFKGSCTGDELAAKTGMKIGDMWHVTADSTDKTYKANYEYAWNGTAWCELGGPIDLSSYATKTEAQGYATTAETNAESYADGIVATEATARETADTAINTHINYLYKENGDGGYVASTGVAVSTTVYYTRSGSEGAYVYTKADPQPTAGTSVVTPTQYYELSTSGKIDARLKSLESTVGPGGSVEEQIDAKIALLNGSQTSGDYVTSVTESAGIVTSTRASKGTCTDGNTGLVDGGTVYSHVNTVVAGLDYTDPKTTNTYISAVDEDAGVISVTRTALGSIASDNTGLVTGGTVYAAFDKIATADIDALFN